ncbi:MAG: BatD family protein [Alloprevotella sp.]|nr:BatD family protein [Alloprevotella sp.]
MGLFLRHILSIVLFYSFAGLYAQSVEVHAPSTVGKGEPYFRVQYVVKNVDDAQISLPASSNFKVLSGPNKSYSSYTEIINGQSRSETSITFTYLFAPVRVGNFSIGPASIKVGSKTLKSKSVNIVVDNTSSANSNTPSQGATTKENNSVQTAGTPVTERDLFIKVLPSKTTVYEEEAVRLTYKVYSRLGVGLQNVMLTKKPDFKDLVSHEVSIHAIEQNLERVGNENYKTGVIMEYVVFPQKSGSLTIPPMTFECAVVQQLGGMDAFDSFFNGGGLVGKKVQRTTPALTIQVNALPEPRPDNYTGGVGQFNISGKLLQSKIKSNEIATYRLTISGTGNLNLITAPHIDFPKDFETFDVKTTDSTKISSAGMTGSVFFDYTFVPRNKGEYSIPPVHLNYFDNAKGTYVTHSTEEIKVQVEQGKKSDKEINGELALRNKDIRSIIHSNNTDERDYSTPYWKQPVYWLLLFALPLLAVILINLLVYWKNNSRNLLNKWTNKRLKVVESELDNAERLWNNGDIQQSKEKLHQAVIAYLSDALSLPSQQVTTENVGKILAQKNNSDADVVTLTEQLTEIEMLRYSNIDSATLNQLIADVRQSIRAIDKTL